MTSVDLFIPCAAKDTIKLPFVLESVAAYLPDVRAVHLCTPDVIRPLPDYRFPVYYHLDRDVLDFDYTRLAFRPTWVYQQFLKLFQMVTAGEWYLVMDADKIINRELRLFDGDKPILFLPSRDQDHGPYYEYSRAMLKIGREYDHSFLSECTLYHRGLLAEMLRRANLTRDQWLNTSTAIITATCCIADAELYGNFEANHAPDFYQYQIITDEMRGLYNGDWTHEKLTAYVSEMRGRDVDILSAHSWHD